MNWYNVKLIWLREVRDQLRDRRTLFMIAVLPLLLYPLLGMSFIQLSQFLQDNPAKVLVVGWTPTPDLPSLVEEKTPPPPGEATSPDSTMRHFASAWFTRGADDQKLVQLDLKSPDELRLGPDSTSVAAALRQRMQDAADDYDATVYFPPDFSQRLNQFRQDLKKRRESPGKESGQLPAVPAPEIYFNSVKEKSKLANVRVSAAIHRWEDAIGQQTLKENDVPETAARPFDFEPTDVAKPTQRSAAAWSKILPFILLIWALTGAFYPAIDLCAGEKERGTLETLLCSPAERSEIVTGKLLAVMMFSMATSILNLASLGVTGLLVLRQTAGLGDMLPAGLPPLGTMAWLLVALVPASALFSALCIALAAFARSSKEGQYYLMPLMLVAMPLMFLPMAPGVDLTLGNSLIPLTGLILLLRMLLEGNVVEALPYVPPVVLVTAICCRLAMRWAVDQFNKENVLFRESERWDARLWFKTLRRDRRDTPTLAAAVVCGLLILVLQFFMSFSFVRPESFADNARLILFSEMAIVSIPVVMALTLTRSPRKTLLFRRPPLLAWPAALTLAVATYPLSVALEWLLEKMYPLGRLGEALQQLTQSLKQAPNWWLPLVLLGLLPAVCEELAFRGFILSGLRHSGHKWRAILISSLFFAVSHQVMVQSVSAFVLGILIAYMAVQTGSLWPGIIFHAVHNSLAWLHGLCQEGSQGFLDRFPNLSRLVSAHESLSWLRELSEDGLQGFLTNHPSVGWYILLFAFLASGLLIAWFRSLSYQHTAEETLQETIEHEAAGAIRV